MTTLLALLLDVLALLTLVPVLVLCIETVAAAGRSGPVQAPAGARQRVAVLVPAHDEAATITAAIRSILPQLAAGDRLLVVADNCTDDTAALAAAAGAEVIERQDPARRGKGYALDFGARYLERAPADIVVIVDADCDLADGCIDRLARSCAQTGRPAQALYLMQPAGAPGVSMRIAQFAWTIKNHVRPLGLRRLGLPCQLMGTGMAFPWSCLRGAPLASGHLVEDIKLGIELAAAGTPPIFCPDATVTSRFPESGSGIRTQRTRWEHGHLGVIASDVPRVLVRALASANPRLLAMALDLSVPPLALLAMLVAAIWSAGGLARLAGLELMAFPVASSCVVLLLAAVFLAWLRHGRRIVSLGTLLLAPLYALRKVPLYARFLVSRQSEWVRSKRD